ncbi:hypothetical protein EDD21DRAFT_367084 [Dissophora ornata]|nr:hypothetical protein EDD21DRAFT_367084 [Dissophora ornata]
MTPTLYRFTAAEGLVHLLCSRNNSLVHNNNNSSSSTTTTTGASTPPNLEVDSVHGDNTPSVTGATLPDFPTKGLLDFDHLVCDFDETITDHDTTSSFDTLASQIRSEDFEEPQMTWSEILQAYLDDLEKVDVVDLCHLNIANGNHPQQQQQELKTEHGCDLHHPQPTTATATATTSKSTGPMTTSNQHPYHHHDKKNHHLLDPKVRELKCHIDGRTFTPEPELPVPKIPSLQPWIHSQVRKRAVEKVSLDRVYESGNLVGLTKSQIREYGRQHIRLRPGMVEFLKAFVKKQEELEQEQSKQKSDDQNGGEEQSAYDGGQSRRKGELWILSVNWSQDLIRGAMDQVFGSEEATSRYLPDSNLISSNLQFLDEDHEQLTRRRKSIRDGACGVEDKDSHNTNGNDGLKTENDKEHLSNGQVRVQCLTGTDKMHAFRKLQKDYASKHDLALTDTKWAYLGDSSTDLGCLVEADVGIIIGKSKTLLTECGRSGIQVIDLVEKK